MLRVLQLTILAATLASVQVHGQTDVPEEDREVIPWRVGLVSGTTAAAAVGLHIYQTNAWWSENRQSFHFLEDWRYALWADKAGHAMGGVFISDLYQGLFRWSGLKERSAVWAGFGVGLAYLTYVEIQDGFGAQWGFSGGDALFNSIGAAYPVLQHYVPELENLSFKFSYRPTGTPDKIIFDDYTGQIVWGALNLKAITPDTWRLPPWLNIAVGYAARTPDPDNYEFLSESQVYIGLDIDPRKLPVKGRFWEGLSRWLNHLHIPSPAVRITPDLKFLPFAF